MWLFFKCSRTDRSLHYLSSPTTGYQADDASRYVSELEQQNPTPSPAESELLKGRWLLVYASEDATRSSPFFWAFRKLLDGTMVRSG